MNDNYNLYSQIDRDIYNLPFQNYTMNGIRSSLEQENYDICGDYANNNNDDNDDDDDVCSVSSGIQDDTPSGVISFSSESESSSNPEPVNENNSDDNYNNSRSSNSSSNDEEAGIIDNNILESNAIEENNNNKNSDDNNRNSNNDHDSSCNNDNNGDNQESSCDTKIHEDKQRTEFPNPKELHERGTPFIVCEVDEQSPARISVTDTNIFSIKRALNKYKNSRCQRIQVTLSDPSAKVVKGTNKRVNLSELDFLDQPITYILEQPDSNSFDRVGTVLEKYESKLKNRELDNIVTTTEQENENEIINNIKSVIFNIYDNLSYYLSEELVILSLCGLVVSFIYFVIIPIFVSLLWKSSDISYYQNIKFLNQDATELLNNEIPKGKFIVDFDNMIAIPYHGNLIGYNYEQIKARTINLFDKSFKLISKKYDSNFDKTRNFLKNIFSKCKFEQHKFHQIILEKEQKISTKIIKLIQHAFDD